LSLDRVDLCKNGRGIERAEGLIRFDEVCSDEIVGGFGYREGLLRMELEEAYKKDVDMGLPPKLKSLSVTRGWGWWKCGFQKVQREAGD
jgi:hypothetical protein